MVNIGIIGVGEWGKNHVRIFKELEFYNKCSLLKVCDRNQDYAQSVSKIFNVASTSNPENIVKDSNIDAVVVCTPASTHYELVKTALLNNKDVLVEKPICLKSEEAEELVRLAEKNNKILLVGLTYAYNNGILALKEAIEKGILGNIDLIKSQRRNIFKPRPDCGVIFDFAYHDIFIADYLLDKHPIEVNAVAKFLPNGHDYKANINLKYENNVDVDIWVDLITAPKIRMIEVVGSEKTAIFDDIKYELEFIDNKPLSDYFSYGEFKLITRGGTTFRPVLIKEEPLKQQDKHFLDCINTRRQPITNGTIGLNALIVTEAVIKSALTGEKIKVNMDKFKF
jgi:UDP-2-acetamido-3-amino-2,3-dideoxy-glucuronate N-acetyltransferase